MEDMADGGAACMTFAFKTESRILVVLAGTIAGALIELMINHSDFFIGGVIGTAVASIVGLVYEIHLTNGDRQL